MTDFELMGAALDEARKAAALGVLFGLPGVVGGGDDLAILCHHSACLLYTS